MSAFHTTPELERPKTLPQRPGMLGLLQATGD
jgi:hypothetical protein